MKRRLATMSETRVWARRVIDRVISDHVHGPVGCLHRDDLAELRRILRDAVDFRFLTAWEKRILREEWRVTLGHPPRCKPKMKRLHGLTERDILPSMRGWARKHGLISDPQPTP